MAEAILEKMDNGIPAEDVKAVYPSINEHTIQYMLEKAEKLDVGKLDEFSRLIRIYAYLWKITEERKYGNYCFDVIRNATLDAAMNRVQYNKNYNLKKDVTVHLPVRVNWGADGVIHRPIVWSMVEPC